MQGKYNPQVSIGQNTGLGGPLLSRFDAVLVLRDLPQPGWDAAAADHILAGRHPARDNPYQPAAPDQVSMLALHCRFWKACCELDAD